MRVWGYYALHTLWNSIRKMFRSTVLVVMLGIILVSGLVGGIIGLTIGFVEEEMESQQPTGEDREGYGDPEYGYFNETGEFLFYEDLIDDDLGGYDENGEFIYYEDALEQGLGYYDEHGDFVFYYDEITEEDMAQILLVAEAGVALIVVLLLVFGAKSGMKQGSDIFLMADVNFLFTAPMKPQSVLLFRLTFQMLAVFASTLYLLFQIPNLVMNLHIPVGVCFAVYGVLILIFILQKLVSVGMYTYTATHDKIKKYVVPGAIALGVILLAATVGVYLQTGDFWKTLEYTWSSEWSRLIPFIGWAKAIVIHLVAGNVLAAGIYTLLMLLGIVGLTYIIWNLKADFYEDALAGAQKREEILQAASENRKAVEVQTSEAKKKKRQASSNADAIWEKAKGAQMFLAKELLIRRRMAKFGVLTTTMIWYIVISTGLSLLNTFVLETSDFTLIGVLLMLIVFFRNYGNPIAQETSMNWLFLVPESPYKKVFYSMMAGTCATGLDLLPGMVIATVMRNLNPLTVLLWYTVLLTMDFMLSGVGMMLEALFPATALDVVKSMIQMMLKFAVVLFIAVAITIGTVIGGFELGLIFTLILNLLLGATTFIIYPSFLHDGIA